jgi:5-methylcytosine-specific restriction endonuclease McrA
MTVVLKECRNCNRAGPHEIVLMTTGPHYAKAVCQCGRFVDWVPKPETDATKYKRPKQHTDLVNEFGRGYCELCGFEKDQLPYSETLNAHHVERYSEEGPATRENVWILCTACHALVEHQRTYRGKLRRAIAGDLAAIKQAMDGPATGETLDQLVARKRQEQSL